MKDRVIFLIIRLSVLGNGLLAASDLAGFVFNQAPRADYDQRLVAAVHVNQPSVQIAEPFSVDIVVQAPIGTSIHFSELRSHWGDFEVISYRDFWDIPDVQQPERRTWTRSILLESLTTGELPIPELEIQAQLPDGQSTSITTQAKSIRVVSVLENRTDPMSFRDIKDTIDIQTKNETGWNWLIYSLAIGVSLALFAWGLGAFWINQRPPTSPSRWALSELRALQQSIENKEPLQQVKQIFQQVEGVVKSYLQARTGIPAPQISHQEICDALATLTSVWAPESCGQLLRPKPSELIQPLRSVLARSEQARYANRIFSQVELNQTIDQVIDWIETFEYQISGNSVGSLSGRGVA